MTWELPDIVNRNRETTSGYHLEIGRAWRLIGEPKKLHSPLAYSAFEFRCAIERLLFELFYLVRDGQLEESDLKAADRFSSLLSVIDKSQGGRRRLERRIVFNRILSKANSKPKETWFASFSVGKLHSYWQELSEYCHRQLKHKVTWKSLGNTWVFNGYATLNEVETYLWSMLVESHLGWYGDDITQPEVLQAREDFINGIIDERMLEIRLNLMLPVMVARSHVRHPKK